MRQISLTDYFCKGLYLFDIFEDIVFLGKRLFTVRKFLDFSELLEMVNTQGYFLEFLYLYSGLNLNQYGVASPCRTICTVCGFALSYFCYSTIKNRMIRAK
ncbi:outer membrane protein P1 [Neisseria meningitidis]|nr:outer membrane protein P1 [Neisseria meningitidis]